jgi:hypothetical protein
VRLTAPGAALTLLLAGGCGGVASPSAPETLEVHGAAVVLDTSAPFAHAPDFPDRIESTLSAALTYWGGDWSALQGTTIELTDAPHVTCGTAESALGCQDGRSIRLTVQDPSIGQLACVEQTVLVHEVGHAVVGDPLHLDPRWMELEPVEEALSGRPGYTQEGTVACVLYLSVWRHILGRP